MKQTLSLALLVASLATTAAAQVIQAPFDTDYSFVDLGSVPSVPANAGGLTFLPGDPNTLLIGGAANSPSGKIYSITLTRGVDGHVTGFAGTATAYANAPGIGSGGIDGGLAFAPNSVLFYTSYPDNSIGQIKPGSTGPDKQIALSSLLPTPIETSVGALAFVPAGFPGAGRFKVVQYNGNGNWYDVTLAPNAGGTYDITGVTFITAVGRGPEGVIYVQAGSPQFSADSVLISEYGGGSVGAYDIDTNGDVVVASRRPFITGLTGAEGAAIDPQTGDFFFSTFGGGNKVIAVRGFLPPPTTSSTSTSTSSTVVTSTITTSSVTTTDSTSTTFSTTTTLATSSTSTSTSVPGSTSTTSTTVPGDCASVPVGPTFASIRCRLDALVADTTTSGPALGKLTDKLLNALDKAGVRLDAATSKCEGADGKHAGSDLKKLARKFIQYSHRLRTQSARKKIDEAVREPLAQAGDELREDTSELRDSLSCPEDAS